MVFSFRDPRNFTPLLIILRVNTSRLIIDWIIKVYIYTKSKTLIYRSPRLLYKRTSIQYIYILTARCYILHKDIKYPNYGKVHVTSFIASLETQYVI